MAKACQGRHMLTVGKGGIECDTKVFGRGGGGEGGGGKRNGDRKVSREEMKGS